MQRKHQRLLLILVGLALFSGAVALVCDALREGMLYFYTPTQLRAAVLRPGQIVRLGGQVKMASLQRQGLDVRFVAADAQDEIHVVYQGALPDLFGEGRSMVAEGAWGDQIFYAQRILAKHDERYMPAEVAQRLAGQEGAV